MFSMSRIVQVTADCPPCTRFSLKVNTDAVVLVVTKQLTRTHIRHLDSCYVVFDQPFLSEEIIGRECHFAALT